MTEGYVFSGQHKQKWKKVNPIKGVGYVVLTLLLSLGVWMLFYVLGVGTIK